MNGKKGIASERCQMLKRFMDRDLSEDTQVIFMEAIINCAPETDHPAREAKAVAINKIIDSSKTEEEMLEKLKAL